MAKKETSKKKSFWAKYTNLFIFVVIAGMLIYWLATYVAVVITPDDSSLLTISVGKPKTTQVAP